MKNILLILLSLIFGSLSAQNIQLHYDFGSGRKMLTSTVEYFNVDSSGNTFFFIDFDYGGENASVSGVSNAYWELAREFRIKNSSFSLHTEINAGMFRSSNFSSEINTAFLVGGSYFMHSGDYSKSLTLQTLYKGIQDKNLLAFQLTAVWSLHFFDHKFSITGFADFWREDVSVFLQDGTAANREFVFLTEPQFWFAITNTFSVGGELEISNNFGGHEGIMINPTLAVKWNL